MVYYQGKDEPMGRCMCPPVVKLPNKSPGPSVSSKLQWFPVAKKGCSAGEMLVAAELILKEKVYDILKCS